MSLSFKALLGALQPPIPRRASGPEPVEAMPLYRNGYLPPGEAVRRSIVFEPSRMTLRMPEQGAAGRRRG